MSLKFNIDRPKISDEEIKKRQDFNKLVKDFKEQSIKKARGDESWWKNKKVQYSTIIAGVTVICTITYLSLFNNQKKTTEKFETKSTLTTKNTSTARKPFVNPPSQKLKQGYASYKVNNAKGAAISHSTASVIKIPRNSFVDKTGKDVVGDVTIEYKEFHDLGDIVLSGIPMAYDSAGQQFNLESAGMFDIRGSQNGEPVFIKPSQPIEVVLASSNPEDRFNQYYLDTTAGNWQYLKRDNPARVASTVPVTAGKTSLESPLTRSLTREIETLIPRKKDSVTTVYQKRVQQLPAPARPLAPARPSGNRPSFKLEGSYSEFPELSAFDNVLFEVGTENTHYNKDFHEITWSDLKITEGPVKGKNYLLHLSYRNRSEKLVVYPVLTGKDFEKANDQYKSRLAEYNSLAEKKKAEEQRLLKELETKQAAYVAEQNRKREALEEERARIRAKFNISEQNELASSFNVMSAQVKTRRIFSINQFGIYNSDCPHKTPSGAEAKPVFALESGKLVKPDAVYLIDHTKKTVYQFDPSQTRSISYDPANDYSMCIFKGPAIYLCDKEKFSSTAGDPKGFIVRAMPDNADDIMAFKKELGI